MSIIGKVMAPLFAAGAVIGIAAGAILWSPPEPVAAAAVAQQEASSSPPPAKTQQQEATPTPTPPAKTPVADGIRPLGNKFVRAFHFDNATKNWLWYDPEAPAQSTLTEFRTGRPYYILVTSDATLVSPSRPADNPHNLTCKGSGAARNCWNTINW